MVTPTGMKMEYINSPQIKAGAENFYKMGNDQITMFGKIKYLRSLLSLTYLMFKVFLIKTETWVAIRPSMYGRITCTHPSR